MESVTVIKKVLKTKQVHLRLFKQEDLNDFYDYAKVEGVGELAGWFHHKSIDESQEVLNKFLEDKNTYAIVDNLTNKVIGSFALILENRRIPIKYQYDIFSLTIGYVLSKDYWNKGIMTQVVKKVIDYLFTKTMYNKIFVGHFETNIGSKRVIQKCGFKFLFELDENRTYSNGDKLLFYYVLNKPKFYWLKRIFKR